MSPTLLNRALACRYTRATFRTLTKHATSGAFDTDKALRLLRRNVRDVQPSATRATQQAVAQALLDQWSNQTCAH